MNPMRADNPATPMKNPTPESPEGAPQRAFLPGSDRFSVPSVRACTLPEASARARQ